MNPNVFITIAFVGIAFMVPITFFLFVFPQIRRENAGVQRRESRQRESVAATRSKQAPGSAANKGQDAEVR